MQDDGNNVIRPDFGKTVKASSQDIEKLTKFAELIRQSMVMVTLDARVNGVRVPSEFVGDCALNLNFSLRFGIKDFIYDEKGVHATLEFAKGLFTCELPWPSIYAIHAVNGEESFVWPLDIPKEQNLPPKSHLRLVTDE